MSLGKVCPLCRALYKVEIEHCSRDGTHLQESDSILAGKFLLKGRLGAGAMGVVYEAEQLPMGRKVAVKLLHAELCRDPALVKRFEREARAASTVDHPNAVVIHDSGQGDGGEVYIAMEFLSGESLAELLQREPLLPPARAAALWLPVVEAMACAHDKGVVHRDLKPDNIFISNKSGREQVKVLDFGIAKIREHAAAGKLTKSGSPIGTALYMAPEVFSGEGADTRSDVYALGLILVEMLTGRLPWDLPQNMRPEAIAMQRLLQQPLKLRALCVGQSFSAALQQLVDDVLAKEPERRPEHAGELLIRIRDVPEFGGGVVGAGRGGRSWWRHGALGLGGVTLGMASVALVWRTLHGAPAVRPALVAEQRSAVAARPAATAPVPAENGPAPVVAERPAALALRFVPRGMGRMTVVCGQKSVSCGGGGCQVQVPAEARCVVSAPGRRAQTYSHEDLAQRAQSGGIVAVSLAVAAGSKKAASLTAPRVAAPEPYNPDSP